LSLNIQTAALNSCLLATNVGGAGEFFLAAVSSEDTAIPTRHRAITR